MLVQVSKNRAVDPLAVRSIGPSSHHSYVQIDLHDGHSFRVKNEFKKVLAAINAHNRETDP